jgi:hypothetical protein
MNRPRLSRTTNTSSRIRLVHPVMKGNIHEFQSSPGAQRARPCHVVRHEWYHMIGQNINTISQNKMLFHLLAAAVERGGLRRQQRAAAAEDGGRMESGGRRCQQSSEQRGGRQWHAAFGAARRAAAWRVPVAEGSRVVDSSVEEGASEEEENCGSEEFRGGVDVGVEGRGAWNTTRPARGPHVNRRCDR